MHCVTCVSVCVNHLFFIFILFVLYYLYDYNNDNNNSLCYLLLLPLYQIYCNKLRIMICANESTAFIEKLQQMHIVLSEKQEQKQRIKKQTTSDKFIRFSM